MLKETEKVRVLTKEELEKLRADKVRASELLKELLRKKNNKLR